jgi:F-type H+-transporting ATPase subunit b
MANTASTGTPTDAPHAKVFPPLDVGTFAPQLVWLALTFALLYVLLKRAVLPRVGEVIEERSDRVKRDLAQALLTRRARNGQRSMRRLQLSSPKPRRALPKPNRERSAASATSPAKWPARSLRA